MGKNSWLLARLKARELYCVICGELILSAREVSREHEPPKSRGGKIVGYAHKSCNQRKGALTQEEYDLWLHLENIRTGRLLCEKKLRDGR